MKHDLDPAAALLRLTCLTLTLTLLALGGCEKETPTDPTAPAATNTSVTAPAATNTSATAPAVTPPAATTGAVTPPAATTGAAPPAPQPIAVERVTLTPISAEQLLETARTTDAELVLVNFWATWCGPCVEELPDLVRLQRAWGERGLRVLLVSRDEAELEPEARALLARLGVDFETFRSTGREQDFIATIGGGWTGLIPATLFFDAEGQRLDLWEDQASYEAFEAYVAGRLGGGAP